MNLHRLSLRHLHLAAALVLFVSSPDKRRAAVTQGFLPLLSVAAIVIGLLV